MADTDARTILQSGIAKSGNFWLYKILQALLDHAGVPPRSYIQSHPIHEEAKTWELSYPEQASVDVLDVTSKGFVTRISSRFEEAIEDLDAYLAATRHVWSHAPYRPLASGKLFEQVEPVVYIVRDPRDVMLSQADFHFTPYFQKHFPTPYKTREEYLEARIGEFPKHWAAHVRGYMEAARRHKVHFVFYERLLADFDSEVAELNRLLGFDALDDKALAALRSALSLNALKRGREGHVNKGERGRWRHKLTVAQNDLVLGQAGDELERLGYPVLAGDTGETPPPRFQPL